MKKLSSLASLGLFTVVSVFGTACAEGGGADEGTGTNSDDTVQSATEHLVAEVEGDGFKVRFLEPEPGLLVEDELGTAAARHRPEDNNLDIVQRYELLAGKKAPAALLAAAARAGAPTHEGEPLPQTVDHSGDKANLTSSEAWFVQNFCTPQGDRLWTRKWSASTYWSDRVEYMKAAAYVVSGAVWYDVSYSGAGSWSWYLNQGEYNGRRATSAINRAASSNVRSSIQLDTVHHCVNYHF